VTDGCIQVSIETGETAAVPDNKLRRFVLC
jgi:hypothetical protein